MRWLVAVVAAGFIMAAPASAEEFAVGSGAGFFQENGGPFRLTVSAHGSGADAMGHVRGSGDYLFGEFKVEGPVTCAIVAGKRASIKYRIRHAEGPGAPPEGSVVQVYVEDNGQPVNGQPVDRAATDFPEPPISGNEELCLDPTLRPDPFWTPIESGNYTVRDAG